MSNNDNNTENESGIVSKALKIIAVPVSAASGLFYGNSRVRNQNYNNLRNRGIFKDLKDAHDDNVRALMPEVGKTKDISEDLSKLNKALSEKIDTRIKDIGFGTFQKKFKNIHSTQRVETIIGAITVTTLVLGAILAIADHKSITDLFADKSKDNGIQ